VRSHQAEPKRTLRGDDQDAEQQPGRHRRCPQAPFDGSNDKRDNDERARIGPGEPLEEEDFSHTHPPGQVSRGAGISDQESVIRNQESVIAGVGW
jgi:hypothetical protein